MTVLLTHSLDAEEKKLDCYLALEAISKRMTCRAEEADAEFDEKYIQSSDPSRYHPEHWNPTQKYLLRGVATTNEITYICVRAEANLIDLDENPGPRDQWWRVQYAANEPNPVKVEVYSPGDFSLAETQADDYCRKRTLTRSL